MSWGRMETRNSQEKEEQRVKAVDVRLRLNELLLPP
jgi:hypothetical protein